MIKSMTGFGKAQLELKSMNLSIEIKSINSKGLDLSLKIPSSLKEKENELRNEISKVLERGKIECTIYTDNTDTGKITTINQAAITNYYKQLEKIIDEIPQLASSDLLGTILKLPDVLKSDQFEIEENDWTNLLNTFNLAIKGVDAFRIQEGRSLEKDILMRIELILKYLNQIEPYEKHRLETIRTRLTQLFNEFGKEVELDKNRFEQEIIYYLEKLDITEEKVRLKNHCKYFLETTQDELPVGKKLAFIVQEMGREINTLGSKANHADIQKIVVQMKDELEKIKEQLMNVL